MMKAFIFAIVGSCLAGTAFAQEYVLSKVIGIFARCLGIVTIVVGVSSAITVPAAAETWVCDVKVGKRQYVLARNFTFKFDEYIQDVVVTDSYGLKFGVAHSFGEVRADNDTSRRITWAVRNLPVQDQNIPRGSFRAVSFSATVMKKNKK